MRRSSAGSSGRGNSGAASTKEVTLVGDPRMPEAAKKYVPSAPWKSDGSSSTSGADDEIPPVDLSSIAGIIMGMIGVMMKQKICCWAALLLSAQALANMRSVDSDLKQILCCVSFSVMGLVTNYFGPVHPGSVASPPPTPGTT